MIYMSEVVNDGAYMDFKEATDRLFDGISHDDLAHVLGVSIATIRQGRLAPTAKAYRSAPPSWEDGVKALARKRIRQCETLLEALADRSHPDKRLRTGKPVPMRSAGRVSATTEA